MANYQISSILMKMAKKSEVKQSAYSNRFHQLNSQNGSFSNRCGFFPLYLSFFTNLLSCHWIHFYLTENNCNSFIHDWRNCIHMHVTVIYSWIRCVWRARNDAVTSSTNVQQIAFEIGASVEEIALACDSNILILYRIVSTVSVYTLHDYVKSIQTSRLYPTHSECL